MPVSPEVHPESEGRVKGLLTRGTGLASPAPELLTVVWVEALRALIAEEKFADCVLETAELVTEARAWRASNPCGGLGEARIKVEQVRKISQRRVAPFEEDTGFIFYGDREFSHIIFNLNV